MIVKVVVYPLIMEPVLRMTRVILLMYRALIITLLPHRLKLVVGYQREHLIIIIIQVTLAV
jgi:hypothetical protein